MASEDIIPAPPLFLEDAIGAALTTTEGGREEDPAAAVAVSCFLVVATTTAAPGEEEEEAEEGADVGLDGLVDFGSLEAALIS